MEALLQEALGNVATRDDIRDLRSEFKHDLDEAIGQIIGAVDKGKADRETVKDLEIRVSVLEEKTTPKNN